jgi:hypothetical protein
MQNISEASNQNENPEHPEKTVSEEGGRRKKRDFIGENNNFWKGGFPKCADCDKKVKDRRAKRCFRCNAKAMIGVKKNYIFSEKQKMNQFKKGMTSWSKGKSREDIVKEKSPSWKGGRGFTVQGYVWIYGGKMMPIVSEHRSVMENHLGRKLRSCEIVHHKNGIKTDNRIENLEITTRSEHARNHGMKNNNIKNYLENKK